MKYKQMMGRSSKSRQGTGSEIVFADQMLLGQAKLIDS